MRLVDTHCHIDLEAYADDLKDVIGRAVDSGVERVIVPGINAAGSARCVELASRYEPVFAAVGIHPHEADNVKEADIDAVRDLAVNGEKVVAVGEIGLDNCKGYSGAESQRKLLDRCLDLAHELDLPVILHCRNASDEMIDMLDTKDPYGLKGVVHCFSGDEYFLRKVLEKDLFVSFSGCVTFNNAEELRAVARLVPPEKLLLETDGPYMSPVPVRGKRNEPAFVKYLLPVYAELYSLSEEDIARITTHNADSLFRLGLGVQGRIVYPIRDVLYVNMTPRCTNRCTFCTRNISSYVKGHQLKLDKEPAAEEIIAGIGDPTRYREVTFCGLGESTLRLGVLKKVASYVKSRGGRVRLNTNGEGNLIAGYDIVPELVGIIDKVSVSLNADNAGDYVHTCRPVFGGKAYEAVVAFIRECSASGIEVEVSCLDFVGDEALARVRAIAEEGGAEFRLRHLNIVG